VVIVTTIRALKHHGKGDLATGIPNLEKHVENIQNFGVPSVIALNRFPDDTEEEIALLKSICDEHGWKFELSEVFAKGGEGGKALASTVIETIANETGEIEYSYELTDTLKEKIAKVAKKIYGADGVDYSSLARGKIRSLQKRGYGYLPVCIAKTQFSLSDNRRLVGRPSGFEVEVQGADISAGAGFVIVYMGDVSLMPGLPQVPSAVGMDVDEDGNITGVF